MSVMMHANVDETTMKEFDEMCEQAGVSIEDALGALIKEAVSADGALLDEVIEEALPIKRKKMTREEMFGCMRDLFKGPTPDDFNEPLEDFKEYM